MMTFYSLIDGELRIARDDPPFEWHGKVDSMPVLEVSPASDGSSVILLLDPPPCAAPVQNLVKLDAEGNVVWRGELPAALPGDCFVSFSVAGSGRVLASTWGGHKVALSGETGEVLNRRFTK